MKLVAFVGRRRSGKDTAALALVERGYTQVRFADPLKCMMRILLGHAGLVAEPFIEGDMKEYPLGVLCGKTARHAMQTLGTEWGRLLIGDDLWIRIAMSRVAGLPAAVISDCRFPNEAAAVKAAGGKVIKIVRATAATGADTHPSEEETDLIEADHTIINNTTIEELQKKVLSFI